MEYRYVLKEGVLTLKDYKKGLEVVSYEGEDIYLTVPEKIPVEAGEGGEDGLEKPVISIGKKAMLSRKSLRRVILPETIEEVGDWAFAYCDALREVVLPEKEIRFGKGIFRECGRVKSVSVRGKHQDVGALLAAAVTLLDTPYLFTPVYCGEEDWLRQWDARMLQLLHAADQDGYSKMVLCGEEDYGSTDLEAFLRTKRRKKVRLAMLRLLCGERLSGGLQAYLEGYLKTHTKGCRSEESWQVVLEEGETHPEYVHLFLQLGCVTRENIEAMIGQMREDQPQLRAAFLRYRQERLEAGGFFAGLSL